MALHPRHVHPNPAAASEPHHAAYPSSESDAQVDAQVDAPASTVESRPLLATSQHAAPQANRVVHRSTSSAPSSGRKRRTPLKCTQAIWVTFTVLLIAILGYSSQLCIMLPYYNNTPSFSLQRLAAVLVPFNLGLIAIFYNYWLCVTTDPGSVPAGWEPEWSALDPLPPPATAQPHAQTAHDFTSSYLHPAAQTGPTLELKQAIYRPRYCKSCAAYKPPRSHHCKTCQRCVLRMDHHCPWLANCVGHFNYVHFIRFLFYVDITCVYHLVIISCRVLDTFNSYSYWREPSASELVWLVVNYALCTPVILLVGIFSMYHFYCTSINQTTIESWEKDRTATMIRRGRIRNIKYPYNLGFWRNCASILGHNPVMWCIPNTSSNTAGDGLKFPVADGLGKYSGTGWVSFRSIRSRHWKRQTEIQDAAAATQMYEIQQRSSEVGEVDDESYVDPELEASVMHRLRWENWHRQQARSTGQTRQMDANA